MIWGNCNNGSVIRFTVDYSVWWSMHHVQHWYSVLLYLSCQLMPIVHNEQNMYRKGSGFYSRTPDSIHNIRQHGSAAYVGMVVVVCIP